MRHPLSTIAGDPSLTLGETMPLDEDQLAIDDGPTVEFVIHYDPQQYEDQALLFARRLFAELDVQIGSLALIPSSADEFDVWLNGERIHSFRETGREPSPAQAVQLARTRLAATQEPTERMA